MPGLQPTRRTDCWLFQKLVTSHLLSPAMSERISLGRRSPVCLAFARLGSSAFLDWSPLSLRLLWQIYNVAKHSMRP